MPATPEFLAVLNRISKACVERALDIHKKLGPGLLESAYVRILVYELRKAGFQVKTEVEVPLVWDDQDMGTAYRADIIINDMFVIEVKAAETQDKLYSRQLLTYLKLLDYRLGLVINFGMELLVHGIERVVNDL